MRTETRFRRAAVHAAHAGRIAVFLVAVTHVSAQASSPNGDGGPATSARLENPWFVTVDPAGNVYTADLARVRRVNPQGVISSFAGDGIVGYGGDGRPAASTRIGGISALLADSAGNIYTGEPGNHRIRRIGADGVIVTIAGGGLGDATAATAPATAVVYASTLAMDASGNIYFGEDRPVRIRRLTPDGVVTTIAGNGTSGFSGDGGPALLAQLGQVAGLAVDRSGDIYLCDFPNRRIRKITPDGVIRTIAGTGTGGYSGDNGPATLAKIECKGLAADASGRVYFGDAMSRVRAITPDGVIRTIAGNGTRGFAGDNGPATAAQLYSPSGVALDAVGNLYIADTTNGRIRKVTTGGVISSIAGSVPVPPVPGGVPPPAASR